MPRLARVVVPDVPHHITQRGNNRQDVFFTDDDRIVYLRLLKKYSREYGLSIEGYCLMTNHIHIIATPSTESSLAMAIGRTDLLYTQYINLMHGRSGHLWQNRFFSCPLGSNYFWRALCYIERNPVRAGASRFAWTYRWSSAAAHIGKPDKLGVIDLRRWTRMSGNLDWRSILRQTEDESEANLVRIYCRTGRPLGSDRFISKLESRIGRRLRLLPVGRPKNKKSGGKTKQIKANK